jgi:type I restriction enzyme M protein
VHRDLSDADIQQIAGTYHAWKNSSLSEGEDSEVRVSGNLSAGLTNRPAAEPVEASQSQPYADIPGFCKSANTAEIRAQGYMLTPGRYVGAAEVAEDDEPFEQKMARLIKLLHEQQVEAHRFDDLIEKNLKELNYGE